MEQDFGCYYVQRPAEFCRKGPSSVGVDSRCIKEGNRCILDTGNTPTKEVILVPTEKTLIKELKQLDAESSNSQIIVRNRDELNGTISGPISSYVVTNVKTDKLNTNNKYVLFGDAHYGMENTCVELEGTVCNDVNLRTLKPINNDSYCSDVAYLLMEMFNEAELKGEMVDFYLEIPYLQSEIPSSYFFEARVSKLGYLYKLFYVFYDCFTKNQCRFKNVRFHYADVRLKYTVGDITNILNELQINPDFAGLSELQADEFIKQNTPYVTDLNTFSAYLTFQRIENVINQLIKMISTNSRNRNEYIENTDILMKNMFYPRQTLSGRLDPKNIALFKLYLNSENFVEDAKSLFADELESIQGNQDLMEITNALTSPSLLVNRRGKVMNRVGAQLEALRMEDDELSTKMGNIITEFFTTRYTEESNKTRSEIIEIWDLIITLYNNITKARIMSLGDMGKFKDELISKFNKYKILSSIDVGVNALFMDVYLMARMFRTFPITLTNKGVEHVPSTTKIVYAGGAHIYNYRDFFEFLGSKIIKYDPNEDVLLKRNFENIIRCLQVKIEDFLSF